MKPGNHEYACITQDFRSAAVMTYTRGNVKRRTKVPTCQRIADRISRQRQLYPSGHATWVHPKTLVCSSCTRCNVGVIISAMIHGISLSGKSFSAAGHTGTFTDRAHRTGRHIGRSVEASRAVLKTGLCHVVVGVVSPGSALLFDAAQKS